MQRPFAFSEGTLAVFFFGDDAYEHILILKGLKCIVVVEVHTCIIIIKTRVEATEMYMCGFTVAPRASR